MINLTFNVACYKWYILTVQETKRQVVTCTILHQTLLSKSSNNSHFALKKDYVTNPATKLCFDPPVWNTKKLLVKVAINLVWNTNSITLQSKTETDIETLHGGIQDFIKLLPQA